MLHFFRPFKAFLLEIQLSTLIVILVFRRVEIFGYYFQQTVHFGFSTNVNNVNILFVVVVVVIKER